MVMQNLVNFIFLSLSSAIINVVPILYGMFKVLSNIQIVDYNDSSNIIFNVWNNLYILLSVLILFAIAIKLVNAIVNPDVLTDNKKGVKKAFFNALISVFLVVLLPFVFRGFHEVQSHILNNDIIPKFVFQSETQEDGGNMLAWMAISSTIDLEAFDEIDLIGDLDLVEYGDGTGIYIPADPEEHDPKWLLTELSILRPWANPVIQAGIDAYLDIHPVVLFIFLVATIYELLILVLDTALRTFKLLLLEMMTPIVLGAYVFKSEILKSWALEYIKTFLQIFLLVLALCFMEYMVPLVSGLLQIDGIFHMPSTFLIIGIFRLLLYIGLLRLVKQIGPLINKIFGTNIQAKGGIKGRLGEMAAVGGIAQRAWGALGNTAKNAGKFALLAPGALGFAGADKLYKSKHEGKSLRDTKAFRQGKGILQGARTALKTGNPLQAYEAYDKGSAAPSHSITDRLSASNQRLESLRNKIKAATGIDMLDDEGNIKNTYIDKDGKERYIPTDKLEQARDIIENEYKKYGQSGDIKVQRKKYKDYRDALSGIKGKQDEFITTMNQYADALRMDGKGKEAQIAGNIAQNIKEGKKLTGKEIKFLKDHSDDASARNALALNSKITSEYSEIKRKYDGSPAAGGIKAVSSLGDVALSTEIGSYDSKIKKLDNDYEIQKPKLDVLDQDAISKLDDQLESINKTINGSLQNNSSFSNYIKRTGNRVSLTTDVPVDYLVSMSTGIIKPGYKDYGFSAGHYEAFDNFVKAEAAKGVSVGSQQFGIDLKAEVTNAASPLAGGSDNVAIDFMTNLCSNPVSVLDNVHNLRDNNTGGYVQNASFTEYIDRVTPYAVENPLVGAEFVTKLSDMGYTAQSDTIIDQVAESTVAMDDPVSIIGSIRSKMTDDNAFSKYVGIVESKLDPQEFTKLRIEMGKIDGGRWYKDPNDNGKWKKR